MSTPSSPARSPQPAGARVKRPSPQPTGPAPAPTVQKLRLRYAKRGPMRFTSARDFQRVLERALRSAGVPMAYSAGFHPQPRISYTNAAATGVASEAEYVEISVTERLDPEAVRKALNGALPEGYRILAVAEARPGALPELLRASVWRFDFGELAPNERADVLRSVEAYLALETAETTRMFKKGPRTFDTREAVVSMRPAEQQGACAILEVVVRHTTPAVRPGDVLVAMRESADLRTPRPPVVTRLAQGPFDPATAVVGDPFAAGTAPAAADGDA